MPDRGDDLFQASIGAHAMVVLMMMMTTMMVTMMTIMMMMISRHQIPIHDRLRSYDPSLEDADSCTYPQHRLLLGTFEITLVSMIMVTRKC